MNALVTGGGGFLGGAIVRMLHDRGHRVTVLGRNDYPHLADLGIQTVRGDLRDPDAVRQAVQGMDVVFHAAALAGIWGPAKLFWDINVQGTRHLIAACQNAEVPKLIFTSSPSVVFGSDHVCGADESLPYPNRYLAHYPRTKAVAERDVLAANAPGLATVALRPHLIWGPGDPHLIPRVLDRARRGKLVQVGDGTNQVDIIYITNAAQAHLQAADALEPGSPCAGRAYFISQGQPVKLWPWLGQIIEGQNLPPVRRRISYRTAYFLGTIMELAYRARGVDSRREPPMTRFLAAQLAKSHYFDITAARRDLGFDPAISTAQGLDRLQAWLGNRRSPSQPHPRG